MSQAKLQTMVMQRFWGVIEVYYGIVQVVNWLELTMIRGTRARYDGWMVL